MEGVRNSNDVELRGIIPTTFTQIFTTVAKENENDRDDDNDSEKNAARQYLVRASYIEIYNEEARDLLSDNPKQKLDIKEDTDKGVYIKGCQQVTVSSIQQILGLMD